LVGKIELGITVLNKTDPTCYAIENDKRERGTISPDATNGVGTPKNHSLTTTLN
jgi:hypothetical protein